MTISQQSAQNMLNALRFILEDENSNLDYEARLIIEGAIGGAELEEKRPSFHSKN